MNLLRIQLSGATIVFASKTHALMRCSTAITYDQCHLQPATYVAQLASPPDATREILEQLLTALASSKQKFTPSHVLSPHYARPTSRLPTHRFLAATTLFLPPLSASSQELHRLQSGVDDHARLPRHPAWLVIPITPKLCGAGCVLLYVDDDWRMEYCFAMGCRCNALTLAAISCVLYSAVAAPLSRCHC